METEAIDLAVVMQRTPLNNRWQPWQWKPLEIIVASPLPLGEPRCLRDHAEDARWLFTGFGLKLYRDESEGYFLNIDSPAPCWFVMWRMEEHGGAEIAVPKRITLSYNEAARLMDGGEQVDTLLLPDAIRERLTAFVQEHYRPEPKRKRKRPSFEGGEGVARMARAEGERHGK
jgi:hypothetical protein